MTSSIQLLYRALAINPSQTFWCQQLGVSRSALAVAKTRGRLSPSIAGNFCRLLGEPNAAHWIAIAGLEAEPATHARTKALHLLEAEQATAAADKAVRMNVKADQIEWQTPTAPRKTPGF